MKGSLSDCLVERGLSGTWALGPALPPLPVKKAPPTGGAFYRDFSC